MLATLSTSVADTVSSGCEGGGDDLLRVRRSIGADPGAVIAS